MKATSIIGIEQSWFQLKICFLQAEIADKKHRIAEINAIKSNGKKNPGHLTWMLSLFQMSKPLFQDPFRIGPSVESILR